MPKIDGKPQLVNRGGPGLLKKKGSTTGTKLTNRGPAGLLKKAPTASTVKEEKESNNKVASRIALKTEVVAIDSLHADPENARVHPNRNMEAIKASLNQYGQVKPLVVRRKGRIIIAGNGTWEAAKQLGWQKIAVNFVEMNDAEAAGYGLADNRTAELAKWDFEVLARLEKLISECGGEMVGWTMDELEVLRAADWTPPPIKEDDDGQAGGTSLIVSFTPDQYEIVDKAIEAIKSLQDKNGEELDQAQCLEMICLAWLEGLESA